MQRISFGKRSASFRSKRHGNQRRARIKKAHFGLIGRLEYSSAPRALKGLRVVPDLIVFVVSFASSIRPRIDSAASKHGVEWLFILGCYRTLECPVEWRTDACPTRSTAL